MKISIFQNACLDLGGGGVRFLKAGLLSLDILIFFFFFFSNLLTEIQFQVRVLQIHSGQVYGNNRS